MTKPTASELHPLHVRSLTSPGDQTPETVGPVHDSAVADSVDAVIELMVTGSPTLFFSLTLIVFAVFEIWKSWHSISGPKVHLSGKSLLGLKMPKYAKALIIIRMTRKAQPYVVRNSKAAWDFRFRRDLL